MRLPRAFYADLKRLRDQVGEAEYNRDDTLLPNTVALIKRHLNITKDPDVLYREVADAILDRSDRADDDQDQGCFDFGAHLALGDKQRIKRGAMGLDHLARRKRVIDANKRAQDSAWAFETLFIEKAQDALENRPASTRVKDVLNTDGSLRVA